MLSRLIPSARARRWPLVLEPGGKAQDGDKWTKGLLLHTGNKTASRYELRTLQGRTYLIFEWKSGDYMFRQAKPSYYVMAR